MGEHVGAEHCPRSHGRHVQAVAQGRSHAHPAAEAPVVVLGDVQARARGQLQRRVVQQAGGGQNASLKGQRVHKGLQGGARLTTRQHRIHVGGLRQVPTAAHPGQHLAGGVVEHDDGAVFNALEGQLAQMLAQQVPRQALPTGVQRGGHLHRACRGLLNRQAGQMGGHLLAQHGAPFLRQCHRGEQLNPRAGPPLQHQHLAGAPRHHIGTGIGTPDQCGRDGGLLRVEAARVLAKQGLAHRRQAYRLTTERHEVEVGLQDVAFAPLALQLPGMPGLAHFLRPVAAGGARRR